MRTNREGEARELAGPRHQFARRRRRRGSAALSDEQVGRLGDYSRNCTRPAAGSGGAPRQDDRLGQLNNAPSADDSAGMA